MTLKSIAVSLALVLGTATLSTAQITEKKSLTISGARTAIAAAVAEAQKRKTTGVIAVVDDGGNLMAVERLDGTFSAGANISIGKARTAALFKRPTKTFEDIIKNGYITPTDRPGIGLELDETVARQYQYPGTTWFE